VPFSFLRYENVVLGGCGFADPNEARESSDASPDLSGRNARGVMFERSEWSAEPKPTQIATVFPRLRRAVAPSLFAVI
jgi:hypothetical protein